MWARWACTIAGRSRHGLRWRRIAKPAKRSWEISIATMQDQGAETHLVVESDGVAHTPDHQDPFGTEEPTPAMPEP